MNEWIRKKAATVARMTRRMSARMKKAARLRALGLGWVMPKVLMNMSARK